MIDAVPEAHVPVYGYVEQHKIRFRDLGGMYMERVEHWVERYTALGEGGAQLADAPFGYWGEDGHFVITNGRHRRIAMLLMGYPWVLVCWLERRDTDTE